MAEKSRGFVVFKALGIKILRGVKWIMFLYFLLFLYICIKNQVMQPAKRYFNTSGPNIREEHYTLERAALVARGVDFVHRQRYFTIWAPRQAGKSTSFRLMAEKLEQEGYKVCHINFENYKNHDLTDFLNHFRRYLLESWGVSFEGLSLAGIFSKIETIKNEKLVLIIDEVEGINTEYFGDFLHSIRNAYHFRHKYALKSVIFVGVSNITGVVQDNASPFNISDSLQIDYFTKEELYELLAQHEAETGQLFDPIVKEKMYAITVGQPGIVNGFCAKLVELSQGKPVIDYLDYLVVEDWYLFEALDKNVANLINKVKQYQKYLEELLFLERKTKFDIDREHIRFFYTNGLIKYDNEGNVVFWVPLYKKRLQKYFYPVMNGEAEHIIKDMWLEKYLTADNKLNIDKIIREYQAYANMRGFRYFIEYDADDKPKGLREAALIYSFETYIQAFLLAVEGKSYLEAHAALGRTDLRINVAGQECVIESKVYYDLVRFAKGKVQLAYYCNSIGLKTGVYLIFVNKNVTNPFVFENEEEIDGVEILTYIVKYDTEIDFSEHPTVAQARKKKNAVPVQRKKKGPPQ